MMDYFLLITNLKSEYGAVMILILMIYEYSKSISKHN